MRFSVRFSLSLALCVCVVPAANAQQVAASQTIQTANSARAKIGAHINLRAENMVLERAISEIAKQAGMGVLRRADGLPLNTRITVDLKDVTVVQALGSVTRGTGVSAEIASDGETIILATARSNRAARAQGVITGKVVDAKTGKGVSGATVSISADARGVVTDEDGSYRLTAVSTGLHTISVRLVGYAKQSRSVTVGEGATVLADFKLEASASVLGEVVVTGTVVSTELKAVPSAITVITAKQIEERGITRIDQLFRGEIPGVFSLEFGGSSPNDDSSLDEVVMFSRGATKISTSTTSTSITNTIKTYVDGVELADAKYLSQIDPKSIQRIEILTGPQASTIYGANAVNGVMQIFTKRGSTAIPAITLSFSEGFAQNDFSSALATSHQYDGSVSGQDGKLSYSIGTGWDYTGAWTPGKQLQRTSLYGGIRHQSGMFSWDLSVRQGWTQNKVEGHISQVSTALAQEGMFVYSSNSGLTPLHKRSLSGRTFSTTLGFIPSSLWSHQLTLGGDASDTQVLGSIPSFAFITDTTVSNFQKPNSRVSQSYSSTLRVPLGTVAQATLTYGGDHWRSRTTTNSTITWDIRPSGEVVPLFISRPIMTTSKNSGAYIQGQFGLWDALFFTYGVRADWAPVYGEKAKVRPGRYGASYSRDFGIVSTKLRGSYGRSIKPPGANLIQGSPVLSALDPKTTAFYAAPGSILYERLPNPDLGPEFQQGGEGGLELYLGNRGSLIITRFNQTVDGLISILSAVDSVRALEPGRPTTTGVLNCSSTSTTPSESPRSDGYCYYLQSQNLNVGSIRNQGWEMQSNINVGPFVAHGTYSWTKSRVIGITTKYRALLTNTAFSPGQSFSFLPEHTWALNMSYAHSGTSLLLNINGLAQSLRTANRGDIAISTSSSLRLRTQEAYSFASSLSSIRLPQSGYTTANMNASHRFSSKLEATLQVTNLTNYYQNDFSYQYPTLGRQTRLGARIRWQ